MRRSWVRFPQAAPEYTKGSRFIGGPSCLVMMRSSRVGGVICAPSCVRARCCPWDSEGSCQPSVKAASSRPRAGGSPPSGRPEANPRPSDRLVRPGRSAPPGDRPVVRLRSRRAPPLSVVQGLTSRVYRAREREASPLTPSEIHAGEVRDATKGPEGSEPSCVPGVRVSRSPSAPRPHMPRNRRRSGGSRR